jgi:hypothetical protein
MEDDRWRDRPIVVTQRTFVRLDGTLVLGRVSPGVGTLGEPLWKGAFRGALRRRELRDMEPGAIWHYCRMMLDQSDAWPLLTPLEARDVQNAWRHIG